jgi:hypothetical protein
MCVCRYSVTRCVLRVYGRPGVSALLRGEYSPWAVGVWRYVCVAEGIKRNECRHTWPAMVLEALLSSGLWCY